MNKEFEKGLCKHCHKPEAITWVDTERQYKCIECGEWQGPRCHNPNDRR